MFISESIARLMGGNGRYIATLPTVPFALNEARIVAELMLSGMDRKQIKDKVHNDNLFRSDSESSEKKILDYTYNRLKDSSDELKVAIISDDLVDARMANLVSIMQYDLLFREFVFEVYSDCRQRHNPLSDYEIMSFFERKAVESDIVAGWKHVTVFKLRRLYTRILFEAGFLRTSSGTREITTPFISSDLTGMLCDLGFQEYVEATVGYV